MYESCNDVHMKRQGIARGRRLSRVSSSGENEERSDDSKNLEWLAADD